MSEILGIDELQLLIQQITEQIQHQIVQHNRYGQLNHYLKQLPIDYEPTLSLVEEKEGKILIIGQSNVRKKDFRGIASSLGLDPKRFEFVINYEEVKEYSFGKLAYNDRYDYILAGPMPHKVKDLKDHSSILTQIESNPTIYPELIRVLNRSGELKITKSSFKRALEENVM